MIILLLFVSLVGADCTVQQLNTNYLGFNITTFSTSSTTLCCNQCVSNSVCLAYTFSSTTKTCTLKYYADPGSIQNSTGVVAGQLGPLTGCNRLYQGLDYPNYNLPGSPYANVTDPVTCCKMCANNSKCMISTWVQNVGCNLKYFYSHTELTVQTSTVICDVNKKWTPYVGSPPPGSECIFDYYKNYVGIDILVTPANDTATCCAYCKSNPQCMFANFDVDALLCILKSDITQYTYDMNYVAIFHECRPWTTCCNSTGRFVPLGGPDPNCPTHCDGLGNCAALSFKSCFQVYYLYPNLPSGVYNINGNQVYCDKGWQLVSHFSAFDGIGNLDLEVYYYFFVDRPIWIEAPPENSTTRYKKYTNPLTPNATFDGLHHFDFIHWGSVLTQVGANYGIRQQFFRSQSSDLFDATFRFTYDGVLLQNDAGPNQPQNPLLLWILTNRTVLSDTTNITWNTESSILFWKPYVALVPAYSACGGYNFGCCNCNPSSYNPGYRFDGNAGIMRNQSIYSDTAASWAPLLRSSTTTGQNFDLIWVHQATSLYGEVGGNQTLNYYLMDDNDPNDCLFNYCNSSGDGGAQCVDLKFHYNCICSLGYGQESWLKTEITYHVTCVLYDPCQINNGGCADYCLANLTLLCGCADPNAYLDHNNVSCICKDGYVQEEKNKCVTLQATPQPRPYFDCQGNYGTLFTCYNEIWISSTDVALSGINLINSTFELPSLSVSGNVLISESSVNIENNLIILNNSVLNLQNSSILVRDNLKMYSQSTVIFNTDVTLHIEHCVFLNGSLTVNAHLSQEGKRITLLTSQCTYGTFGSFSVNITDVPQCFAIIQHIDYSLTVSVIFELKNVCNSDVPLWIYIVIGISVLFSLLALVGVAILAYKKLEQRDKQLNNFGRIVEIK